MVSVVVEAAADRARTAPESRSRQGDEARIGAMPRTRGLAGVPVCVFFVLSLMRTLVMMTCGSWCLCMLFERKDAPLSKLGFRLFHFA